MSVSPSDEPHLRRAITLAAEARSLGDPPFGSVLVDPTGTIVAEARNVTITTNDITAHPELILARWAAQNTSSPESLTLYASCQPCAMCANAIARSGIGRVVYALSTEQLAELKPPGTINPDAHQPRYDGPALLVEAQASVRGYYGCDAADLLHWPSIISDDGQATVCPA
jgi:tRNA(Arg) A34 adenosine deaminase TadA